MSDSCSEKLRIRNRYGLHARPATDFAAIAAGFDAAVRVRNGEEDADGKSVMELMFLAATQGTEIEVDCTGADARACLRALRELVERGFDEDDEG